MASVVSATSCARRRLIRDVRLTLKRHLVRHELEDTSSESPPDAGNPSGVARERVEAASSKLGAAFPDELVSLLTTSDGLTGDYGLGLIWPLDEIVSRNEHFRTFTELRSLYMPFDALLFFGDAGNGDQFGYSLCGGEITRTDIFCWSHEDDSRTWVALSSDLSRLVVIREDQGMSGNHNQPRANKTDAGNGSKAICRVSNV